VCTHYTSLPNDGLLSQAKTRRTNQQINNRVQQRIDSLWIYTVESSVHESQCSGFWLSVITEVNTTVSTIYDGLWHMYMSGKSASFTLPLFQLLVTGSDEMRWHHMPGKSVCFTVLLCSDYAQLSQALYVM